MARWILHVDLDEFLAAVEVRRRPELKGRPVVVGGSGDPTQPRMVVATASYEARAFGVHSGMPLRTAARRCPDAVFLPSDRPAYDEASAEVMETLRKFPVVVEVWGWDEAAVGTDTDDPEALAAALRRRLGRHRTFVLDRHRRQQAAGQDGDRLRQAGGHLSTHRRELDGPHGRPSHGGVVGDRSEDGAQARGPRRGDGAAVGDGRPRGAAGPVRPEDGRLVPDAGARGREHRGLGRAVGCPGPAASRRRFRPTSPIGPRSSAR